MSHTDIERSHINKCITYCNTRNAVGSNTDTNSEYNTRIQIIQLLHIIRCFTDYEYPKPWVITLLYTSKH